MVTYILRANEKLTPEEEAELAALRNMPDEDIIVDDDCPETTDEEWEFYSMLMRKYKTNRVTKEMVLAELQNNNSMKMVR